MWVVWPLVGLVSGGTCLPLCVLADLTLALNLHLYVVAFDTVSGSHLTVIAGPPGI